MISSMKDNTPTLIYAPVIREGLEALVVEFGAAEVVDDKPFVVDVAVSKAATFTSDIESTETF